MANKYYTVKDTKTGKVIRKTKYGTKVRDVKLKSRAKNVKKHISSKRVSEREAREKAKQDLRLIAREEELKTIEKQKEVALSPGKTEALKKVGLGVVETLKKVGLGFVTKAYTPKRQAQIYKKLTGSDSSRYDYQLNKIDNRRDLNSLQKENLKRELLGIERGIKTEKKDFLKIISRPNAFQEKSQEKLSSDIKKNLSSPEYKLLTKQTLTPEETSLLFSMPKNKTFTQTLEGLGDKQRNILNSRLVRYSNKLLSEFDVVGKYTANLGLRIDKGEKNPFYNDVKTYATIKNLKKTGKFGAGVSVGIAKTVGDFVNFITGVKGITINSKGKTYDGLIALPARRIHDYTISLMRRVEKQKGGIKKLRVINNDFVKLVKGSIKIGKAGLDVTEFAFKNPELTSMIIGAAIFNGVISGKADFLKNPAENTGRAFVWLFPNTIIKGVTKSAQLAKKGFKKFDKTLFSVDETKQIINKIEVLEKLKTRTREQTQLLKLLREQVKINKEYKYLTSAKFELETGIVKSFDIKSPTLKQKKKIKVNTQKVENINKKIETKVKTSKKKTIRINDLQKAKLIKKLFEVKPPKELKKVSKLKGKALQEVKELERIKESQIKIQNRIKEIKKNIISPVIDEDVKARLIKESDLLTSNLNEIILNLKYSSGVKATSEELIILNQLSKLSEYIQKLNKKIIVAQKLGAKSKLIGKSILLLNKSGGFMLMTKAQKGQYLKSLDKMIKSGFKTKVQEMKPSTTIKKIIERNKFTKEEMKDLLKPTNSKRELTLKLKDLDKRINALKSQKWSATILKQYNINKRISKLEALKQKL